MGTGYIDSVTVTIKTEIHDDYSSREEDKIVTFKRELKMVCSKYSRNFEIDIEND